MRWLGWIALSVALVGAPAWAQEAPAPSEPLALRYDAPAEACPDATAFFAQLRARTTRVRAPNDGENARVLVVRVAGLGRGFIGHLHFDDGGVTTSPRVVEAASCAEVIEALGLSAALAVDPSASTAPVASLSTAPVASLSTAAPAPPPAPPAPSATTEPPPAPTNEPVPRPAARVPSQPLDARFGAGVAVEAASLGGLVPSGRVFLEGTLRSHASLFAPSLRVFVGRSLDVDQMNRVGGATLTWTSGGLDACPIRVHLASTLALRPCAEVMAGTLAAHGQRVDAATDETRAWAAVDVHGRLEWELLGFLSLEAEAGAMVPLIRDTFFFRRSVDATIGQTDVYQAPSIGYFGRLGAGVHFP